MSRRVRKKKMFGIRRERVFVFLFVLVYSFSMLKMISTVESIWSIMYAHLAVLFIFLFVNLWRREKDDDSCMPETPQKKYEKKKAKRIARHYWHMMECDCDDVFIGRMSGHMKTCSSPYCCGNPRRAKKGSPFRDKRKKGYSDAV